MNNKSFIAVSLILSLLLLVANYPVDGRKDRGEYWRDVVKDHDDASTVSNAKANCFEQKREQSFVKDADNFQPKSDVKPSEQKSLINDFKTKPDLSIYHNDVQQIPDISIYYNDVKPTYPKSFANVNPSQYKSFVKDFEPSPDATIYDNDIKSSKQRSFVKDYETRQDLTIYPNDIKPAGQKLFINDLKPIPDATIYHE